MAVHDEAMPLGLVDYLARLDRRLWPIPATRRREILAEVSDFLSEDLAHAGVEGSQAAPWLLLEHGTPEDMARRFNWAEWKDRSLGLLGVLAPVAAAALWMAFLGMVLGFSRDMPGYSLFMMDFPVQILVLAGMRCFWRKVPGRLGLLLAIGTGLVTGLLYCHEVCRGEGIGMLEHGLYGAYFGLVLERRSPHPDLAGSLLDVLVFIGLMQLTYMGREGVIAWMDLGCLTYHLMNALGMALLVWLTAQVLRLLRQSEAMMATGS